MAARVMKVRNSSAEREAIVAASEVLDRGGLVVLPTETVYGVAARATCRWCRNPRETHVNRFRAFLSGF
ncbi:MAG: hypothetical protein BroJett003_11210 [Planctomycetota bacterium]|nr:MAG: hypothetical protein BroJett003_11210 [Planctomycetota bacterium]